jgi:hypothetical protein
MIGIPRHARNPDASWKLIETLYLSDTARRQRRATSPILPPLPEDYAAPEYHRPDPYFGGQPIQALYATLAPTIPPRTVSPLTVGAQIAVGLVLSRAVDSLRTKPTDSAQLESQCAAWLREADMRLRHRLAHSRLGGASD